LRFPAPARRVPMVIGLALGVALLATVHAETGQLPSLEHTSASDITPISELLQETEPVRLQKSPLPAAEKQPVASQADQDRTASPKAVSAKEVSSQSEQPAAAQADSTKREPAEAVSAQAVSHKPEPPTAKAESDKASEKPEPPAVSAEAESPAAPVTETKAPSKAAFWPVSLIPSDVTASLQPAVDNLKRRVSGGLDVKQNLNALGFSVRKHERGIKPVSYSPLPAVVVFPVVKHRHERAFGDLPLLFAREYAQRIELKAPETKVYHPVYSVDELRIKGFGHVYDQVMSYYIKAGRPEPTALDYLLKQLTEGGQPVARVIFVEADLDMGQPDAAFGLLERVNGLATDGTPKHMRYLVRSRLQVFDAESPEFPMVWAGSRSRSVKVNRFMNVTPSVYADSDSQQAFARVSRDMSRELLLLTPREVYMAPQYDVAVQGKVVSGTETSPFPNLAETKSNPARVNDEHRKAIERILQRQNSISP
jgi:hypothetical protein